MLVQEGPKWAKNPQRGQKVKTPQSHCAVHVPMPGGTYQHTVYGHNITHVEMSYVTRPQGYI